MMMDKGCFQILDREIYTGQGDLTGQEDSYGQGDSYG